MVVSSGRAKELDELLAENKAFKAMIRDCGLELMTHQRELRLEEERKLQAEEERRQRKEERDRKAAERLAAAQAAQREKEQAARDAAAQKAPTPHPKRESPTKEMDKGKKKGRDDGYGW